MAFHIPKIEPPKFYMDVAFKRAQKIQLIDHKKKQYQKINSIQEYLVKALDKIQETFPQIDELSPFYKELFTASVDVNKVKKSIGGVIWAKFQIKKFTDMYRRKLKRIDSDKKKDLNTVRSEYYGRVSSVLNQIKKELTTLEEARRIFIDFPIVKTSMKTVCIAGFPNVGKTTLLYKLTGSKADIQPYAFTTQGINISYIGKLQFLDTPGTLNRVDKMNTIEFTAYLAMEHLSDLMVYIFDPTETYPIPDQMKLYKRILKLKKKVIVYVSKTDLEAYIPPEVEALKPVSLEELKEILKKETPKE